MIGITIFIVYLLIGAILAWIKHEKVEKFIVGLMDNEPLNSRPVYVTTWVVTIILLAPILELWTIVEGFKPEKKS